MSGLAAAAAVERGVAAVEDGGLLPPEDAAARVEVGRAGRLREFVYFYFKTVCLLFISLYLPGGAHPARAPPQPHAHLGAPGAAAMAAVVGELVQGRRRQRALPVVGRLREFVYF